MVGSVVVAPVHPIGWCHDGGLHYALQSLYPPASSHFAFVNCLSYYVMCAFDMHLIKDNLLTHSPETPPTAICFPGEELDRSRISSLTH